MKILENHQGVFVIAERGKSVCKNTEQGPNHALAVLLETDDTPENWKDCDYAEKESEDATEADKDAALSTLGVDMTEE